MSNGAQPLFFLVLCAVDELTLVTFTLLDRMRLGAKLLQLVEEKGEGLDFFCLCFKIATP